MSDDFRSDVAAIQKIPAVPMILDVVCRITGMGFAAVARVTEDRWIACSVKDDIAFGLAPGGELQVETTICHEIRQAGEPVIINHVAEDEAYRGHPTPALYGFQSYISMPIVLPDGRFFGTLCAIDPKPAKLQDPKVIGTFKLFAELIGFHLDAIERMAGTEAALAEERRTAGLRDQFIAVLGHDLRNPLSGISGGMRLLRKTPLNEQAELLVTMVQATVVRMTGLVENILDFARGRLGDGITLERTTVPTIEPILRQVIAELQIGADNQSVETDFRFSEPVTVDTARLAQLFSNLLANALTHGPAGSPVSVLAIAEGGRLMLRVSNLGEPIPEAARQRLFQPFFRGEVRSSLQGLGLGLFIAAEIARAHGGDVSVVSDNSGTAFTLSIPTV